MSRRSRIGQTGAQHRGASRMTAGTRMWNEQPTAVTAYRRPVEEEPPPAAFMQGEWYLRPWVPFKVDFGGGGGYPDSGSVRASVLDVRGWLRSSDYPWITGYPDDAPMLWGTSDAIVLDFVFWWDCWDWTKPANSVGGTPDITKNPTIRYSRLYAPSGALISTTPVYGMDAGTLFPLKCRPDVKHAVASVCLRAERASLSPSSIWGTWRMEVGIRKFDGTHYDATQEVDAIPGADVMDSAWTIPTSMTVNPNDYFKVSGWSPGSGDIRWSSHGPAHVENWGYVYYRNSDTSLTVQEGGAPINHVAVGGYNASIMRIWLWAKLRTAWNATFYLFSKDSVSTWHQHSGGIYASIPPQNLGDSTLEPAKFVGLRLGQAVCTGPNDLPGFISDDEYAQGYNLTVSSWWLSDAARCGWEPWIGR